MKKKNAQSSMEFMVILVFILIVMMIVMFVSGNYLVDVKKQENEKMISNYAEKINNELILLSKVESGYERTLILSNNDYDINLTYSKIDNRPSILILTEPLSNTTYYYDLIGNYDLNFNYLEINLSHRFNSTLNINQTILTFKKKSYTINEGLDLS